MEYDPDLDFLSEYDRQATEAEFHHQTMQEIHDDLSERVQSLSEDQLKRIGMILVRQAAMRSSMIATIGQALVVKRK